MADETHEHTTGALKSIEDWEDVPKRLLETIMEGLAKEPSKWMVMGLGFYLGYKGFDVLKWFVNTIGKIGSEVGDTILDAVTDLPSLAFAPVNIIVDLLKSLTGAQTDPDLVGSIATVPVTSTEIAADPDKTNLDLWKHETEAKMIAGAFGALTAVMITTPGFFGGLGEIVKGIGEIVPG